jgi:hypothetical protein
VLRQDARREILGSGNCQFAVDLGEHHQLALKRVEGLEGAMSFSRDAGSYAEDQGCEANPRCLSLSLHD